MYKQKTRDMFKAAAIALAATGLLLPPAAFIFSVNSAFVLGFAAILVLAGTALIIAICRRKVGDPQRMRLLIEAVGPGLMQKFVNIVRIYPAFDIDNGRRVPCVDICIADRQTDGLPVLLEHTTSDGIYLKLPVRVIRNFKNARAQVGRGDNIVNANSENFVGTVGCILSSADNPGQAYLLTCNHVMTGGNFVNPGNLGENVEKLSFGTYQGIGTWLRGRMDSTMDAAIISIDPLEPADQNNLTLPPYTLTEADCSVTLTALIGAVSNMQQAYVIHINQPINVDYDNQTVEIDGLITLSKDLNPNNFTPATKKGDSGALVYHASTLQPIAMVIGANDQFTFAAPIAAVLNAFPDMHLSINN